MSRPWMPFYPADYLSKTMHLGPTEHGAYLLLIIHYWENNGLPNGEAMLARIARMTPEEWDGVKNTISEFFTDDWRHLRIDEEISKAEAKYQKRVLAGRKGGLGKASAEKKQSPSNARAQLNQPQSQPLDSVPNGTGANAPDWKALLFDESLKFLSEHYGKPPDKYRSLLGKWRMALDDDCEALVELIREAEVNREADPVAWITAATQTRTGQREPKWKRDKIREAEEFQNA